ncbi:helix-turn-helix domain-containing protein [Streptomyces sp. NPDC058672]|uniref:helix-turn-helix domain-containing protein n=1 Tax=Streptomyces sp. NPDC058672 TaxID=3346591 RepID=UPI00365F6F91
MTVPAMQAAEVPVVAPEVRRCIRCSCRLSRYNPADLCSGCGRGTEVEQPRIPFVSSHVWQHRDVKRALIQRDFGTLCRLIRELGGLRQEDMATLTELSQSFLSLLESGRRRLTNIDRIIALLDGLGAPVEVTGPMLRPHPDEAPSSCSTGSSSLVS